MRPSPVSAGPACSYVAFFAKHVPVEEVDPQQDTLPWDTVPVFVLDLVEVDGGCDRARWRGNSPCEGLW